MQVSAIIITKDAGATLRRCLESLRWTDEIIAIRRDLRASAAHFGERRYRRGRCIDLSIGVDQHLAKE